MIDLKDKFMNVKDISEALCCSVTKVYLLRDAGVIPMHKNIAGLWVAKAEDINKILENESYSL